jgi:hypothetical protein
MTVDEVDGVMQSMGKGAHCIPTPNEIISCVLYGAYRHPHMFCTATGPDDQINQREFVQWFESLNAIESGGLSKIELIKRHVRASCPFGTPPQCATHSALLPMH